MPFCRIYAIHFLTILMRLFAGDVVEFGNNNAVIDVASHLAQRLFDDSSAVRLSVARVTGRWLTKLPERYSFFRRIIPLILTLLSDEIAEVRYVLISTSIN